MDRFYGARSTDVTHEIKDGRHFGTAKLESNHGSNDVIVIDIQNEYLVAKRNGITVAMVPDYGSGLDHHSRFRYVGTPDS